MKSLKNPIPFRGGSVKGLIADALTKVGLEELLTAVYCQRRIAEPQGKLLEEIESLSLFDGDVKQRLKLTVTDGCGCAGTIATNTREVTSEAIAILEAVPGMTPAHHRDFNSANPIIRLRDGTVVKIWKNPLGVDHIFLGDSDGRMIYGGYVGWIHSQGLNMAIERIRRDLI